MRIAVNGVELFFDVHGCGLASRGGELVDKPVIVALHGGPGIDHSQFVPWLTPIADVAQLILVDHRGNGRSSRPPVETRTLANMADIDMLNWFFARERQTYDVRPRLGRIAVPPLVLTGRHDKIAPPFASDEIVKGIPHAHQEIFEQSGHRLMREENAKFIRTVRD